MIVENRRIAHAWLETFQQGCVELGQDWMGAGNPPLTLSRPWRLASMTKLPPELFGRESGYFFSGDEVVFVLAPGLYPFFSVDGGILAGGDFNDWDPFADPDRWRLSAARIAGEEVLSLRLPAAGRFREGRRQFKFCTIDGYWLAAPDSAPNRVANEQWNANLEIDPARTGHHRFHFSIDPPARLKTEIHAVWNFGRKDEERCLLVPGRFFYRIGSDKPLGAIPGSAETRFAVFAPRASRAEVVFFSEIREQGGQLSSQAGMQVEPMTRCEDGVWEATVPGDLSGWFYWYRFDGQRNFTTHFDRDFPVVDPYARAMVSARGPGIVTTPSAPVAQVERFAPPAWHDLVIVELHLRDVLARAHVSLSRRERMGFAGMEKWIQEESCYLRRLGVNAVELQPIQEFDSLTDEEYHWGYMPVNYFAPDSGYSRSPAGGSQIADLRRMVGAFHDNGIAVILDVVYNHTGIPNHLLFIDKRYYFETDADGGLLNWSGCGNDLRCDSAMARRLVLDSLRYLVETFDVDGFRFDLAELIGADVLAEIEREMKRVKPGIILIAEPWSFRGHIARQLRDTGFASWNDGYRDFIKDFVWERGTRESALHFLTGSQGSVASWPAQTVNYSESHDDRSWIDMITENPGNNGMDPTVNDARRTRLMAAFLLSSVGIPMLAAGQDFLRSKSGVSNTYLRGDLNALDYSRIGEFQETHEFFVGWIRFRLSEKGRLLRLAHPPAEGYFRFHFAEESLALAVVVNADGSLGAEQLLIAFNPSELGRTIPLGEDGSKEWTQLADEDGVRPIKPGPLRLDESCWLPPLSSALWERVAE